MYLIHILLPVYDNDGHPQRRELFRAVADELTGHFGGLTAHTRSPAEGLWKEDSSTVRRDEIVIYEVMAPELDEEWWKDYRARLEARFEQEKIIIQAQSIRVL